jgi:hypothetical protein
LFLPSANASGAENGTTSSICGARQTTIRGRGRGREGEGVGEELLEEDLANGLAFEHVLLV